MTAPIDSWEAARCRRARCEADQEVEELRIWLSMYDSGEATLESFGWAAGSIGATLGSKAARGDLGEAAT